MKDLDRMTRDVVCGRVSPLRYPGGKGRMACWFAALLDVNRIDGTFVEPFAGGAGAGLALLLSGRIRRLVLNDLDAGVHAFWHTLVTDPGTLVAALEEAPFDRAEGLSHIGCAGAYRYWRSVHDRYVSGGDRDEASLARDFLLLNRMNVSGIIAGGPIGGRSQAGRYNISSRFYRRTLVSRIMRIAALRDRITVTRMDAVDLLARLDDLADPSAALIYADPPYYGPGRRLYRKADTGLHARRAARLLADRGHRWVLTYDEAPEIDALYTAGSCDRYEYRLGYSANRHVTGREAMYTSRGLAVPSAGGVSPCRRGKDLSAPVAAGLDASFHGTTGEE